MNNKKATRVSEELVAYALRNSGVEGVVNTPESIETEVVRNAVKLSFSKELEVIGKKILSMLSRGKNPVAIALDEYKSGSARSSVNSRHLNGHYPKMKLELIELWQSGAYKTKEKCVDENHVRLKIARSTGIKWLRGVKK